ncbi:Subtilisin DY [Ensifer adhaerens]|uniref:S8 family serine peptidase n=1 Tax=Ensifer adhaerens TaxID=106592 RepID=UPI001567F221|nr:S8 family serine peptidase [Ensifer adhaerens]NRP20853.1 Subtilisin DY [Ensifer adhaerens]
MKRLLRLTAASLCGLAVANGDLVPSGITGATTTNSFAFITSAHADDDDGGGDDDDGGGSGGGSSSSRSSDRGSGGSWRGGGNLFDLFRGTPEKRAARRPAPVRKPIHVPGELIALGLDEAAIQRLGERGFTARARQSLGLSGSEIVKLSIPSGMTLEAARQEVASASPGAVADLNHYFEPNEGATQPTPCGEGRCALVRTAIGWPEPDAAKACAAAGPIGLIDTAINPDHPALQGVDLEIVRLAADEVPESGRQHGTAVAALLAGRQDSRAPGLLRNARLIAVDAFQKTKRDADVAETYDLVRAIDLLAARGVTVINMSLSGPHNQLLEKTVGLVAERNILQVAAAGNDGPRAKPVYPAAYPELIAVTAVDRNFRPYRRAAQGEHIDVAALGTGVWTAASIDGGRPRTGTSFAAPFVTAAVAILRASNPSLSAEDIGKLVAQTAEDVGAPGKDPVFGWGVLNARELCRS